MKVISLALLASIGSLSSAALAAPVFKDLSADRPVFLPNVVREISFSEALKSFKPTDVLTDENGVKLTGAEYANELAQVNAYLAARGLSLDDAREDFGETSKGEVDDGFREVQLKELMVGLTTAQITLGQDFRQLDLDFTPSKVPFAVAPACTSTNSLEKSKTYSKAIGSKKTVQLALAISGRIEANCNLARGVGEASVSGTVINKNYPIFKAKLLGETTRANVHKIDLDVFIGNSNIGNGVDKSGSAALNISDKKEQNFSPSVKGTYLLLGFIPLDYEVGARGVIGTSYKVKSSFLSASANVTPKFVLQGFAEGGVDWKLVSGKAGASVTVIDISNPNTALAEVNVNAQNKWQAHTKLYSRLDLSALDGKVYAKYSIGRKICVPFTSICTTKLSKKGQETIFRWNGYEVSKTLFNIDDTAALN
jgi:hypothetical protein